MIWRSMTMEEGREKFVLEALDSGRKISYLELCIKYEVSRKTGYKWISRFLAQGRAGLIERSRARKTQPRRIDTSLVKEIVQIRETYPTWGPKKIKALMLENGYECPSESSIGNILKENGLSNKRHYRRHVAQTHPLIHCGASNDVWTYDFKGYFKTGDGLICEPLTITDGFSRYLIRCTHMARKRGIDVWEILQEAFREYGLPLRMRSDNGPPFASLGIGRLSSLSIKLIKVGVVPEWIEPGCPQENGRHERFHSTLKKETASPPATTLKLQMIKFDQFKDYYNNIRPHEALGLVTPVSIYRPSLRKWDGKLHPPEYSCDYETRKIEIGGHITWKGQRIFISEMLAREFVGIREVKIGVMGIYYGPILLGLYDLNKGFKKM